MEPTVHSDAARILQRLLVAARRTAGLRQVEVAARLGEPQSFVSKVERGERRLDVVEFVVFCRAIEADPVTILVDLVGASRL